MPNAKQVSGSQLVNPGVKPGWEVKLNRMQDLSCLRRYKVEPGDRCAVLHVHIRKELSSLF